MPVDSRELKPKTNERGSRPRMTSPPTDASPPPAASLLTSPLDAHPAKLPEQNREVARIRSRTVQEFSFDDELQRLGLRPTRHQADPLGDDLYTPHHLMAERHEKRIENIEREQRCRDAIKIGRDLDNLRSPDWIKLIGLSAALVARCSKKELEQRKEVLASHLETNLEQFRAWNKGEKKKCLQQSSLSPTHDCPDKNDRHGGSSAGGGVAETLHNEGESHKSTMRRGKKPKPLPAKPSRIATAASATTTATSTAATTRTATTTAATTTKTKKHDLKAAKPEFSSFYAGTLQHPTDNCPDENYRLGGSGGGGGGGGVAETLRNESESHKSAMRRGKKPKPLPAKTSRSATAASATTAATSTAVTTTTATTTAATKTKTKMHDPKAAEPEFTSLYPGALQHPTDNCPDEDYPHGGGGGGGGEAERHDESERHKSTMRRGKKPKALAAKTGHTPTTRPATTTTTPTATTTAATATKIKKQDPKRALSEFTSFYANVRQQQQALSNCRKSSRTQTAFGRPLPTMSLKDFELSHELIGDGIAARAAIVSGRARASELSE